MLFYDLLSFYFLRILSCCFYDNITAIQCILLCQASRKNTNESVISTFRTNFSTWIRAYSSPVPSSYLIAQSAWNLEFLYTCVTYIHIICNLCADKERESSWLSVLSYSGLDGRILEQKVQDAIRDVVRVKQQQLIAGLERRKLTGWEGWLADCFYN